MSSCLRLLLLCTLLLSGGSAFANQVVTLLVTEQKLANREFADAFVSALRRMAPGLTVRETAALDEEPESPQRIVVAVGSLAFRFSIQKARQPRVIAALVPRLSFEKLLQQYGGGGPTSAIYLDQPEDRQMALISLLPGPPATVGIVQSASGGISPSRLRSAAQKYRLKLNEETVSSERELASAVQLLTGQSDVMLATPDPGVFNPQSIQSILLSTYRARVPLIGFSPAYTKAGALLSLHSSVRQLAEQTAEMVRQAAAGSSLPAPQSPREFELSVNRQVARSMGIELPSEATLVEQLRNRERQP